MLYQKWLCLQISKTIILLLKVFMETRKTDFSCTFPCGVCRTLQAQFVLCLPEKREKNSSFSPGLRWKYNKVAIIFLGVLCLCLGLHNEFVVGIVPNCSG